jgi:DinB superfamily
MVASFLMNPYAVQLGDRDPFSVIAATPPELARLVQAIGPDALDRAPAPGKWSVRQVLCHLADTELVFAFRLRQSVAEPHHTVQPFDQDRWAAAYAAYTASAALDLFISARRWNILFIASLPPETFARVLTHPERGDMTFRVLVETMAGHDLNHLKQIDRTLGASA